MGLLSMFKEIDERGDRAEEIVYSPPSGGARRTLALDDLFDVYVRPNVSGGMSVLMLLTDGEPVVVRGKLPSLRAVDATVRRYFRSR
jgi:hypothetical protein